MESGGGMSMGSILKHSLWTSLTGVLVFVIAAANGDHSVTYIKLFAISGSLLIALPWIIQLMVSSAVILLHHTKVCSFMWMVRSNSKENHNGLTASPPLACRQVLKESGDVDEIQIRIVIGSDGRHRRQCTETGSSSPPPLEGIFMEIEGRNRTDGS